MSRYSYNSVTDTLKLISGATQANDIYISGIEDSDTSSQAYTVGSYLIYSKVLYKVILAIAQGDTLTPGTNIQSTRVADEINNHLCVDGNEFYFDYQDGKFGYNTSPSRGADTFSPFKKESKGVLLWTNPNGSTINAATTGTASLGSESFTHLIIKTRWSTNGAISVENVEMTIVPYLDGSYILACSNDGWNGSTGNRLFTISGNTLTWGRSITGNGSADSNNRYNIPVEIYGINLSIS